MKAQKVAPIVFPTGKHRMFCYTLAALNAATLVVTIVFVTWILGKVIAALHALVFSLVLPATPDLSPKNFPMLEDFNTGGEVYSILQDPDKPLDGRALYTVDQKDWDE